MGEAIAPTVAASDRQRGTEHPACKPGEPWSDPEPLTEPQAALPPCPIEVLGWWSGWVERQAAAASAPVDFVGLPLLATVGATIANTRWGSPHPGWREPPVLNVGLVGLPSSGKSPALGMVIDPLRAAERGLGKGFEEIRQEYETAKKEAEAKRDKWGREVEKAVKDGNAPPKMPMDAMPPREPRAPRLFTNNATVEALVDILECEPKGIILVSDELSGHIGNMDKYGGKGGDRAFHLETYGGRSYVVDRIKNGGIPTRVPHLSIACVGGIQPDRLVSMLMSGDDDGLAARYVYVRPQPVPLVRHVPKTDPERLVTAILALRTLEMAADLATGDTYPKSVLFTEGAADDLFAFRVRCREREGDASGMFCGWLGKNPGRVVRIACILEHLWWAWAPHATAPPFEISEEAVKAAIRIVEDYLTPHAEDVFDSAAQGKGEVQIAKDAELLAGWVKAWTNDKGTSPTLKDVAQYAPVRRLRDKGRRSAVVALLTEKHWLRVRKWNSKSILALNPGLPWEA